MLTDAYGLKRRYDDAAYAQQTAFDQLGFLADLAQRHLTRAGSTHHAEITAVNERVLKTLQGAVANPQLAQAFADYAIDWAQRAVLFADIMRQRGDNYIAHEEAGSPPVLTYDYEMVMDGRVQEKPVNYALVRILPSADSPPAEPTRRPYVIVDPRAGHGAGIGGSKTESQVGVALKGGHPVYFVIFYPQPEPEQTLADVCALEAEFIRTVSARHPDAPKPIVVGNCQGGWAIMLLGATNPDLTGPVVLNGAPLSYWAGATGKNPLRYMGGLMGGAVPALISSDLGGGKFDGANLVLNFEFLNPGNNWWMKYYTIFAKTDKEAARYLEFERWWGGFYFMNEAEIRWILDNLFIGNKLARGQADLDARTHLDLRDIRSPVIVFASTGDNITPPEQALNWIADAYRDEHEIKVRGRTILYMVHEDVGHLGIFVSSKVAQKEHSEIVSTLKTIEALPPGLYEMRIADKHGDGEDAQFTVSFEERKMEDILAFDDGREDEALFAPVARLSALAEEHYDLMIRPMVKALVTPLSAEMTFRSHPLRMRRYAMSSRNPALIATGVAADMVRAERREAEAENPFLAVERACADLIANQWNFYRDLRDGFYEWSFHLFYGSPLMRMVGQTEEARMTVAAQQDMRRLPEVQVALSRIATGGFAEGVIRIMILIAQARGSVRRSRLERSNTLLTGEEPFRSLSDESRAAIIRDQTLIVEFEPEEAIAHLPDLLPTKAERQRALTLVAEIAGPRAEMSPATIAMLDRLGERLAQAPATSSRPRAVKAAE